MHREDSRELNASTNGQEWIADPVNFGRRYLGPLLELLLGWVLLVYGVLRLLGRVQAEQRWRYVGGSLALTVGGCFWGTLVADCEARGNHHKQGGGQVETTPHRRNCAGHQPLWLQRAGGNPRSGGLRRCPSGTATGFWQSAGRSPGSRPAGPALGHRR
jgi:hypothetical protein